MSPPELCCVARPVAVASSANALGSDVPTEGLIINLAPRQDLQVFITFAPTDALFRKGSLHLEAFAAEAQTVFDGNPGVP